MAVKYPNLHLLIKNNDLPNLRVLGVKWMKNRNWNWQLWLCEIIEKVPNLIVLAGPKPIRFICWSTMVNDIFLDFYANFKNHSYASDWNSVREENMLLPKDISNNFTKPMFFLADIIKYVSDQ